MHHFTRQSASFHAIKYGRLRNDLHQSILPLVINIITTPINSFAITNILILNAVSVVPIFKWMYLPLQMFSWCNAVGFMPVFQWMYFTIKMLSPRNSVRVVLLIARGWRGTSLPRVNVRMGIQRHRCWAFSIKARLQWTLLWRINQRNRNTYGVVPHKLYANPG